MKKILFSLMILVSISSYGQVDSLRLKTSVSLQVRDWLFLNSILKYNAEFENVYDSMKVKLRTASQPTLTTVIKVDSVRQGQIIRLAEINKSYPYGTVAIPYTRINNALKSNAYLTSKIDAIDAVYISQYNERVQDELFELRSVLNP